MLFSVMIATDQAASLLIIHIKLIVVLGMFVIVEGLPCVIKKTKFK